MKLFVFAPSRYYEGIRDTEAVLATLASIQFRQKLVCENFMEKQILGLDNHDLKEKVCEIFLKNYGDKNL